MTDEKQKIEELLEERERVEEEIDRWEKNLRRAERQEDQNAIDTAEKKLGQLKREKDKLEEEIGERKVEMAGHKTKNALKRGKQSAANALGSAKSALSSGENSGSSDDSEAERLRKELKNSSNNNSGGSSGGSGSGAKILGFLALIAHVLLALSTVNGSQGQALYNGAFALLMLAGVGLFMRYNHDITVWGALVAELLLPWLIPFLNFLPESAYNFLILLYVISPVMVLYISSKEKGTLFDWWLGIVLVLFALYIIKDVIAANLFPEVAGGVDLGTALGEAVEAIIDGVQSAWEAIFSGIGAAEQAVESSINYATGGYYKGMVERQQGEPVGLRIQEVRESSDIFYEGDPVYLWADIGGKSFNEEIRVTPWCVTDEGQEGEVSPSSFTVFAQGFEAVRCEFNNLSEGTHRVNFNANFNFQTWSYVTYTFVDQQTKRNFLSQGDDINEELDIDSSLKPIYTPGPVSIGMSSDIPQPVGIHSERGLNTVFGVTLENRWTDGEIAQVKQFDVYVPENFKLEECDAEFTRFESDPRCQSDPETCAQKMNVYRFENIEAPKTFKTMTCRMRLDQGVSVSDVIPVGQQKAQKTFVVQARYDYSLSEVEEVEVEEVPGGGS